MLGPDFYRRETICVARDLLGAVLCRRLEDGRVLRGRIVELEAYDGPRDRASHAFRGRTERNAPMFEAGGVAYVYLIYGMHHCLNVVTGPKGYPAAVLLRAAEGLDGLEDASGPGRLCRAFRITRALDGAVLQGPELWIEPGAAVADAAVRCSRRVGLANAGAWGRRRMRLFLRGHPAVSGPASLNRGAPAFSAVYRSNKG